MKNTIFAEKTGAGCSLLPHQGCHAPKFYGEKFREEPQNLKINLQTLAAFPGWSSAYTCYSRAFRSGKPLISLVLFPDPSILARHPHKNFVRLETLSLCQSVWWKFLNLNIDRVKRFPKLTVALNVTYMYVYLRESEAVLYPSISSSI